MLGGCCVRIRGVRGMLCENQGCWGMLYENHGCYVDVV